MIVHYTFVLLRYCFIEKAWELRKQTLRIFVAYAVNNLFLITINNSNVEKYECIRTNYIWKYLILKLFNIKNIWYLKIWMLWLGDIESNQGPKKSPFVKFCHWNLNGSAAHDFFKIPLLEAFYYHSKFGYLFLSGNFLDSTAAHDDTNCDINGYSMIRADPPVIVNVEDSVIISMNRYYYSEEIILAACKNA